MSTVVDVFSFGEPREDALDWSVELDASYMVKGTLSLKGDRRDEYSPGDQITVEGQTFIVTNAHFDRSGSSQNTIVTCRDKSFEAFYRTLDFNIVWVSVPRYIARSEIISNVAQPVTTSLRVKEASLIGDDGWLISEVLEQLASEAGFSLRYGLPDFHIRQLSIQRGQPVLDFIKRVVAPLMGRVYAVGNTLYVSPQRVTSAFPVNVGTATSLSQSKTYAEPFKKLRLTGGMAEWDSSKWEGKALTLASQTSRKYYMNEVVGTVEVTSAAGYRTYYTVTSDTHTTTLSALVYAKDIFDNDGALVYREEWTFRRKVPVSISDKEDIDDMVAQIRSRQEVTATRPSWPSKGSFILERCSRTVYVYTATGQEWESPLLVEEHQAQWSYLWWSSLKPENIPPAQFLPDDSPFGLPTGYPTTLSAQDYAQGDITDIVGKFSTLSRYRRVVYQYEYGEATADVYDIQGGLLQRRVTVELATLRDRYPNIRRVGNSYFYTTPKESNRWEIADDNSFQNSNPGNAYPDVTNLGTDKVYAAVKKTRLTVENFMQVSLRTAASSMTDVFLQAGDNDWMDTETGRANFTEVNYGARSESALIPYSKAPQALVRKRTMQCYIEKDGEAEGRYVEVHFPLVVNWSDLDRLWRTIKDLHPDTNSLLATTIRIPALYNINVSMLGSPVQFSGTFSEELGNRNRIVAGSVRRSGKGQLETVLVVQGNTP